MKRFTLCLAMLILLAGCKTASSPAPSLPADIATRPAADQACIALFMIPPLTQKKIEQLTMLADAHVPRCMAYLGYMYTNGHGVRKNTERGKALLLGAAERDPFYYTDLARMAEGDKGGQVDLVAARDFYQRASTSDNASQARQRLAEMMERGEGGPRDIGGAMSIYLDQAAQDDSFWDRVQRLRNDGWMLTPEQVQLYRHSWAASVHIRVVRILRNTPSEIRALDSTLPKRVQATVGLTYRPGTLAPEVALEQSSNVPEVDQWVMQSLATLRFPAPPVLLPEQKIQRVLAPFVIGGRPKPAAADQ